jgi:hypothetical protein
MTNKKICSYLDKRLTSIIMASLLLGVLIITPLARPQDTTPPQIIDVRDFPDPAEVGTQINIDCTVIDNIAVASVSILIYSPIEPPTNYSMTKIPGTAHGFYFIKAINDPGTYAYIIEARDPTGNINQSNEYYFTVEDLTPPEVNLIYPDGGEIVNENITIRWTATDTFDPNLNGSITLQYSFDGGIAYQTLAPFLDNTGSYDWDTTTTDIDADTYKIRVIATDDNNNTGQDSSQSDFTVDNTPPDTTLSVNGTLGENGWYINNTIVTLTATDATSGVASTKYRINNGSWTNYTGPFPLNIDGNHTLEFYSLDNGSMIEPTNFGNVRVDTTPPIVTFHKPRDRYLYIFDREIVRIILKTVVIGKLTIEPSINETGSGVERINFDVDGETRLLDDEEPFEWLYDELALLRHRHTLGINARDFAGHTGDTTELAIWVLNI